MMNHREPRPTMPITLHAQSLETLDASVRMGSMAQTVAERWVSGWKKQVLAMEADGSLLTRIKDQADREAEVMSEARVGGALNHRADHEIAQMYDLKPGP